MTKPKMRNVLAELGYRRVEGVKTAPSVLPGFRVVERPAKGERSEETMEERIKVDGELCIKVWVTCLKCNEFIDMADDDDCGEQLRSSLQDIVNANCDFEQHELWIKCPKCGIILQLNGLCYGY